MSVLAIISEMSKYGPGNVIPPGPVELLPETQAFIGSTGISDTNIHNAINQLIADLKGASLWERMIAIYPFVGGTEHTHKFNLKEPFDDDASFRLVFHGTWEHTITGAAPDGTTAYAEMFINPNDDVPPYSMHMSYYSRDNIAPVEEYNFMGFKSTGNGIELQAFGNDKYYTIFAGDDNLDAINTTAQLRFDRLIGSTMYTGDHMYIYRDTAILGSLIKDMYGYFPVTDPTALHRMVLAAYNNANTIIRFCPSECAFASVGFGLNFAQWEALNNAVNSFQTFLNRQV
jgi:hypothetical protein